MTSTVTFVSKTFELLEGLAANNEKDWYDEHKEEFKEYVREPFAAVLEEATERLSSSEVPLRGGSQTMFRQNRDVRFSKDKTPYSTHVSGLLTPSGNKSEKAGIVYLHLDADGGFMAAGFYQLKAAELAPIRDRIIEKPKEFSKVLKNIEDAGLGLSHDDSLRSMPRGYEDYKTHQHADSLKLKSLIIRIQFARSPWIDGDITDCLVDCAKSAASLLLFGQAAWDDKV